VNIHDLVFAVGSGIFAVSLIPAVWKRAVMPLSTSVPTATVLTAFLVNYTTMRFWYAVAMETITCACWWALVVIGARSRGGGTQVSVEVTLDGNSLANHIVEAGGAG
jgi:hypothetical protein